MRAHRWIDPLRALSGLATLAFFASVATACALQHRVHGDATPPDVVGVDGDAIVVPDSDAPIDVDSGCPSGMQFCNGACVAVDTVQRCGACNNDCTLLPGVSPSGVQCSMGACAISACAADRADCDHVPANGCETPLTDGANCGACGTACTGTTPVCVRDMSTGVSACAGGCPSGQTRCPSGSCTDTASDPLNCGGCGMACLAPAGATATCAAGMCGFTCNAGTHLCGSSCTPDTSTDGCGTSCAPCPTDPNGTATCDGTTCGLTCSSGYHLCGSTCLSSSSTASCGTNCTPCDAPPGTVATCVAGACGTMCASGYHLCGGACASNMSTMTCGAGCTPCPAPPGTVATCSGTACGTMCASGYTLRGGVCVLSTCNNQMLDAGEQCDDGNNLTGDGCDANCQLEPGAVVTGCPTSQGVTITQRGTYVFTGDTTGLTNAIGSCSASGGEQGISATVDLGGAGFNITITAQPVTPGLDLVLRHGGACGTLTCTDGGGADRSESYNLMFPGTPPTPFFWVIDGRGGTNAGMWRLVITVT